MNLTYLWCHRAVSCRSLPSSARPALCEGRGGSTCQVPLWQRRRLRWPMMRTHSCGCGDTRGKTKRRFSEKSERAGDPGQEPVLQWQNTVLSHRAVCQGAELIQGTKRWKIRGMEYFFICDAPLIIMSLTFQRCFKEMIFHGTISENQYLVTKTWCVSYRAVVSVILLIYLGDRFYLSTPIHAIWLLLG